MRLPWDQNPPQQAQGWGGLFGQDAAPVWLSLASGLLSPGNDLGAGIGQGLQQAQPYMQTIAERRRAIDAARQMVAASGDKMSPQQSAFLENYPQLAPQVLGPRVFPAAPPMMSEYQRQQLAMDKQKFDSDQQQQNLTNPLKLQEMQSGIDLQNQQVAASQAGVAAGKIQVNPVTGQMYDAKTGQLVDNGGMNVMSMRPATDTELRTAGFSDRMAGAEQALQQVMQVDPQTGKSNGGMVPNDLGTAAVNALGGYDSYLHGDQYRSYLSGARQWISALLRKDSGATITPDEFNREFATYFPQNGDGPKVVRDKMQARTEAQQRMSAEGMRGTVQLQQQLGRGGQQQAEPPSKDDLKKKYGLR